MPSINVKYATGGPGPGSRRRSRRWQASSSASILHKDPKVTAVMVDAVDPADWFCGGHSLAEEGLAGFWLDIRDHRWHQHQGREGGLCRGGVQAHGRIARCPSQRELCARQRGTRRCLGFGGLTQEQRYIAGKSGSGRRPRRNRGPNSGSNSRRSIMSTSAMVTGGRDRRGSSRRSAARDTPHGTMPEKCDSSGSTLSAMPCSVTHLRRGCRSRRSCPRSRRLCPAAAPRRRCGPRAARRARRRPRACG